MSKVTDTLTFVDESGLNGFVRNLKASHDNDMALLCGLPVPVDRIEYLQNKVGPLYEAFCEAAPPGATLHVTDAFVNGNARWRAAAEEARNGVFELVRQHNMYVVYAARRAAIARSSHEAQAADRAEAAIELKKTRRRISKLTSLSQENILERVMTTFALRVNEFGKIFRRQRTDFYFDAMSKSLARKYKECITDIHDVLDSKHIVEIRDLDSNQTHRSTLNIKIEIDRKIDTSFIGDIHVLDKSEPLVFAIDIITNSLYRHLRQIPSSASLNLASSVRGWTLAANTFLDPRPNALPPTLDLM